MPSAFFQLSQLDDQQEIPLAKHNAFVYNIVQWQREILKQFHRPLCSQQVIEGSVLQDRHLK